MNRNTEVSLISSYETWFYPWRPYCHRKHASSVCIEHSNMQSWWSALSFCINGNQTSWILSSFVLSFVYFIWSIYLVSAWSLSSLSDSLPFKLILDVCLFIMPPSLLAQSKCCSFKWWHCWQSFFFTAGFRLYCLQYFIFRSESARGLWGELPLVFLVPMDLDVRLWHSIGPLFHLSMHVSIRPGPFLLKLRLRGRD